MNVRYGRLIIAAKHVIRSIVPQARVILQPLCMSAMAHSDHVTKVTHSKETILVGNALLDSAGEEIRFEINPLCVPFS